MSFLKPKTPKPNPEPDEETAALKAEDERARAKAGGNRASNVLAGATPISSTNTAAALLARARGK